MENDELEQKIIHTNLPDTSCEEHSSRLRRALVNRAYEHHHFKKTAAEYVYSAVNNLGIGIGRWLNPQKTSGKVIITSLSVTAVVLITLFTAILPYTNRQANIALAEGIIKNDYRVQRVLQGDTITSIDATSDKGPMIAAVVFTESGKAMTVAVDTRRKRLELGSITIAVTSPDGPVQVRAYTVTFKAENAFQRSGESNDVVIPKEKILEILRADEEVGQLMKDGAVLTDIYPVSYTVVLTDIYPVSYTMEPQGVDVGEKGNLTITFPASIPGVSPDEMVQAVLESVQQRILVTLQVSLQSNSGEILEVTYTAK
ncbi:MAG: hypothetical protein PHE50_02115 [Dehalococcoidales bacterium]|nr:hypothetical protein [Dehalococcoidales bacterium]